MADNKRKKNHKENQQEVIQLMHNIVTSSFCFNPNNNQLKENDNVKRND